MSRSLHQEIAYRFRMKDEPTAFVRDILQECAKAGMHEAEEPNMEAIENALAARGILLRGGLMSVMPAQFHKGPETFEVFKKAAKAALRFSAQPMEAVELIEATALAGDMVPYTSMTAVLKEAGLHYIPGAGYWRHRVYSEPVTQTVVSDHPRRMAAVIDMFRIHGWPVAQPKTAAGRKLATLANAKSGYVRAIHHGLYVPWDQTGPLPISANVARSMVKFADDDLISKRDMGLLRLAFAMAGMGLGEITIHREANGVRQRKVSFKANAAGMKKLLKAARLPVEVF